MWYELPERERDCKIVEIRVLIPNAAEEEAKDESPRCVWCGSFLRTYYPKTNVITTIFIFIFIYFSIKYDYVFFFFA